MGFDFSRLLSDKRKFLATVLIGIIYLFLAFGYSFIGFAHVQPGVHYHEYSPAKLALEILGHFLFGMIAAIPFLDFNLSLLTGSMAVLIDADHILTAADFNVSGRPDHSFLYAIISAIALLSLARKLRLKKDVQIKLAFSGPVTLFAHISYDIYAASSSGASSFPILIPFSFSAVYFPFSYWVLFEVAAFATAAFGLMLARRWRSRKLELAKRIQRDEIVSVRKGSPARAQKPGLCVFLNRDSSSLTA